MKLLFSFIGLIIVLVINAQDQDIKIDKVEPPNWWVGMNDPNLQLLVYGQNISETDPVIEYDGITITDVVRTENINYMFVSLRMSSDLKAGSFPIKFILENKEVAVYDYEIKERKAGSALRKGFDKTDVLYLLMPDRFSNGDPSNDNMPGMLEKADRNNPNGRHGGDIEGIINHLDYISNTGFTGMWINPLIENNNPEYSYHGYAITDFYKTDPRYGTNEDYLKLVNASHDKGLKVVMDMIFNHCSIHHWFIKDLPMHNWIHQFDKTTFSNFRASTVIDPYASDYDKDKMLRGWFDKHMADLDQRNEILSNYLIQNTIWWIEYSGIDGIRVDTQPYPYKEFISEWGKRVFDEYPNFNIVGEAWLQKESFTAYFQKDAGNKDGYNSNIPSITDFPLYFAMNSAFKENDSWTDGIARIYYVLAQDYLYANPEKNLIFLDNHDLARFYTTQEENFDKWKMGMAVLLTTRGIPTIYYGTELLMTNVEKDGHGSIRKDFPGGWEEDSRNAFTREGRAVMENKAWDYLHKLLDWRKDKDVIHYGKLKHFIPEDNTYIFFRYNDTDCIMIALNNSNNELKALDYNKVAECLEGYQYGLNVITGETVNYLDAFTLPPKSALIIELKK